MALTLDKYLEEGEQRFVETTRADRWYLTFAIPRVDWPDNWSIMPARGIGPLAAFPDHLNVGGTVLNRKANFHERPGWVIMRITYGFDASIVADNSAYITMRTVFVEQSMDWSLDDPPKQMTGRKYIADKPTLRVYGVKGRTRRMLIPYQVIRIYALLDETGRTAYAKTLVHKATNVNTASWVFGGMTFGQHTLMFRGVTLDYSRRWGTSATHRIYNTMFEFIEHPVKWPLTLEVYEWEEVVKQIDLVDDNKVVVGKTKVGALAAVSGTIQNVLIRTAFNFQGTLGNAATPKLIS